MAGKLVSSSSQDIDLSSHSASLKLSQGSLSVWFKSSDNTTGSFYILGFGNTDTANFGGLLVGQNLTGAYADESLSWGIRSGGANKIFSYLRNGTGAYTDGVWRNFIVVMDGTDNRIYVNGVKQTVTFSTGGTGTTGAFITTSTFNNISIGRRFYTGSPAYCNGEIADVRIYNSSKYINDAEAKLIYESRGADGITTGLVGRWKMDEAGDGATITNPIDISGNGYDGSPTNSPTYEAIALREG